MKRKNAQNKALIIVNRCSALYKIREFFNNLFHKKEKIDYKQEVFEIGKIEEKMEKQKDNFTEYIKNISNEETKLLKLQKQYRSGEIKERELTAEQVKQLCDLFDKQINNLIKSNEARKQKILKYRKNIMT